MAQNGCTHAGCHGWYCTTPVGCSVVLHLYGIHARFTQPALLVVQLPVVTYYADTKAIVHHIYVFLLFQCHHHKHRSQAKLHRSNKEGLHYYLWTRWRGMKHTLLLR